MTNTQIYAVEQAQQIRQWHYIQPFLQDQLSQMSDEQVGKFLGGKSKPDSKRSRAFKKLAAPYLPRVWQGQAERLTQLRELSVKTAKGIVEAYGAGLFTDNERENSLMGLYDRIYLRAKE